MMNKKLVHTAHMPIRWGDMDAMGHVNNTVYFRYLEQARIEWLSSIGSTPDPAGVGPVIINAHCTFLKQLKYPGEIEVLTYVGPPGRSSFETIQEIRRLDQPDILAAKGGGKVVWADLQTEKSVPLPEAVRALLAQPISESVS
jgi:acyl-CoA thioester hydrolase